MKSQAGQLTKPTPVSLPGRRGPSLSAEAAAGVARSGQHILERPLDRLPGLAPAGGG